MWSWEFWCFEYFSLEIWTSRQRWHKNNLLWYCNYIWFLSYKVSIFENIVHSSLNGWSQHLFRNFLVGPIFILLSTGIGPWVGVSARVNANCNCPCRFFIWVDANCSYPWTPISLICWTIFIKTIKLHSYLSTDSVHILFLDWFCQNLCRIVHVCLFCSKFPKNVGKTRS